MFSLVAKFNSIRVIISIAAIFSWPSGFNAMFLYIPKATDCSFSLKNASPILVFFQD